jgi:hypothetical protein
VQAHDGKIFARSSPGHGSEFIIELKHGIPSHRSGNEEAVAATVAAGLEASASPKVRHG